MDDSGHLKQTLTLPLLVFYGVGTIVGVGIYVLLGKIAGEAGMLASFSFIVAAVLAGLTGMSYGELSARLPHSAGEVRYVQEGFRWRFLSILTGWLIVTSAIFSTATIVNGYVGYVHVFLDLPGWLIITFITLLLGGIAIWGIRESAIAVAVITSVEIAGLILVIVIAGDNLSAFPERYNEFIPKFNWADWKGVFMGAFMAFFAFIGFEDLVNVSEEAVQPKRDMPRAILWSLGISTLLYLLVAIIGTLGLTSEELDASTAPLADILAKKGSQYPLIISATGLIAIVNGVLVQIVMGSRVLYGMGKTGLAPAVFSRTWKRTRTPVLTTVLVTITILFFALVFEIESLARFTNYVLLFVFMLVNVSLILLKRRKPAEAGQFKVPVLIPILGALLCGGLFLLQLILLFI